MKRHLVIFCVVLISVGGFSCKKEEETSVKITIIDEFTGQRIEGVHVELIERYSSNGIFSSGFSDRTLKDGGYTDVNGNYNIGTFESMKNSKYNYHLNLSSNIVLLNPEIDLEKGIDNYKLIYCVSFDTINLIFNPPPPYGNGDSLWVNFQIAPNYLMFENNFTIDNRSYNNHNVLYTCAGKYFLSINKIKNGVYSNRLDTINLSYHVPFQYVVNY